VIFSVSACRQEPERLTQLLSPSIVPKTRTLQITARMSPRSNVPELLP
jgi:hypothetical protein